MVDLTNLKVGDAVNIDCGGSIVVPDNFYHDGVQTHIGGLCWYTKTGRFFDWDKTPFDIISITPKPEPKRITGWANFYKRPAGTYDIMFQEFANRGHENCMACIEIDVAEGEGLL